MKIKITKTLISDENKEFKIGDDIHFLLERNNKTYDCFGFIKDIAEDSFEITDVQIDKMNISDNLTIKYSEVKDGITYYTNTGWWQMKC